MEQFNLDRIAMRLQSFEEQILFCLLERAQYKRNLPVYQSNTDGINTGSLLEQAHQEYEKIFAPLKDLATREVYPLFFGKPYDIKEENTGLCAKAVQNVNITADVYTSYLAFLDTLCEAGDDNKYGETVEMDIRALRSIAQRIHYGALYVAEAKFRKNPTEFQIYAQNNEQGKIKDLLTRPDVEMRIIERVQTKATHIQEISNSHVRRIVAPEILASFYSSVVIPLTKVGEVAYLLQR